MGSFPSAGGGLIVKDEGTVIGTPGIINFAGAGATCTYSAITNTVTCSITGSGTGATTFVALTDVPQTYSGQAGLGVRVKATADGLEFFDVATQVELDAHTNNTTTAHGAVSAATASKLVVRDSNGDFAAHLITSNLTGTASLATALAALGTPCSAGFAARGVDVSGNAVSCFDAATQTELDTHTNNTTTAHGLTVTPTPNRAPLADGTGKLAVGWLLTDVANGVPLLDSNGHLPQADLPCDVANGVACLDLNGHVLSSQLPPGNGGASTLQEAFDGGNVITGVSEARPFELQYNDAGTLNTIDLYYDTALKHPVMKFSPAGLFSLGLSTGDAFQITNSAGTPLWTFDPTTGEYLAGIAKATFTDHWRPKDVDVDASRCTAAAVVTVNSRPLTGIACGTFAGGAGQIYGSVTMPPSWVPGDLVTFTLRLVTADATSTVWKATIAAHCLIANSATAIPSPTVFDADVTAGNFDTINVTTGTTAGALLESQTANLKLNGACLGGSALYWRLNTISGHTATTTLVRGGSVSGKTTQHGG